MKKENLVKEYEENLLYLTGGFPISANFAAITLIITTILCFITVTVMLCKHY